MSTEVLERTGPRDLRRGWPGLRSLWYASAFSLTGTEAYDAVLLLLTTPAYGSVLSVGLLGVALRLSPVVLGPIASTALDRRPRRRARFVRGITLTRALLVAAFAGVLYATPGTGTVLYLLIVAISALDAIYLAGVRASVPRLFLGDDDRSARLAGANSMLITQWSAIQIVVPAVSVTLVGALHPMVVILADTATFAAAYVLLAGYVKAVEATYADEPCSSREPAARTGPGYWASLRGGFAVAYRDVVTRSVLAIAAVGQGIMFALLLALPILAADRHLGNWTVGVGLGALAVGALTGARLGGRLVQQCWQARVLVADPLARIVSLLLFAVAHDPFTALAACLLMGFAAGASNVARTTLVQGRFDENVLGRVLVLAGVANQLLMPVMPFAWDTIRHHVGIARSFLILAAPLLIVGAAALLSADLRERLRK